MAKSLIDIAYDLVKERGHAVSLVEIWDYVCKEAGLDEETAKAKVGRFYTNLMLDGRFVNLGDNNWDLRNRHVFEKYHIDMKAAYSEADEELSPSGEDEEELLEEKNLSGVVDTVDGDEYESEELESDSKDEDSYR